MTRCPRHPWNAVDSCPICEARIAAAERQETDDDPEEADRAADRYEDWLGEIG